MEDEGAEVDVARLELAVDEAGSAGEVEDGLGDEVGRVGADLLGVLLALLGGRVRADEHSVAAGLADALDDEVLQVVQRVFEVFGPTAETGVYVGEYRLLCQIVADHVGDVGVDALVVGDAGSGRVDEGDVAELVGVHEAGRAEQRVGAEDEWVYEVVVDAAVDDIDTAQALRGPHVDEPVVDQQVAPLDQFRAELLGQEYVLVEGGVVDSGSEQGDDGVGAPFRGQLLQGPEEDLPVVFDFLHARGAIEAAEACLGGLSVGEHVGHAGWDAQVVFEHFEAVVGADEVGAADGDPRAVGGGEAAHLKAVLRAAAHHVNGNHAVVDDGGHAVQVFAAGRAVDVFKEEVEGLEALGESRFDLPPIGGGHDARDAVYGDDPLVGLVVTVDGEGDALVGERARDPFLDAVEFLGGELRQGLVELLAVLTGSAVRQEHLVVDGRVEVVVFEVHVCRPSLPAMLQ